MTAAWYVFEKAKPLCRLLNQNKTSERESILFILCQVARSFYDAEKKAFLLEEKETAKKCMWGGAGQCRQIFSSSTNPSFTKFGGQKQSVIFGR